MSQPDADPRRLPNLPVAFFAVVMGLSGLTIAWEKAQHAFGLDLGINPWMAGVTAAVLALLVGLYTAKLVRYPKAVLAELRHPVKLNFFAAISISLLLLSIAFLPVNPDLSRPLWMTGAALHLIFTLYVVSVWIHHEHFEVHHMNPAWFIPAVGNVLVPVAGVALGFEDISWFFFSIGMLFWGILLAIIFYRVLFHDPIPERFMPTLFILIAPPAVGFIAYVRLVGELDPLAMILYFSALFLTLLLFTQARFFARLRFYLSWWAYSFPLAAISIASMLMFEQSQTETYRWIGAGLLAILSLVVAFLLVRTAIAISRHGICVPGH
ncbi:SLAC1 anion channel family protein [Halochromatium glycolicum]|uniref:C4-dicarboxylate ABC transporter n=1 Tax=Halochromatium glycolicum TaxID=85075 RepID=A0AAJ0U2R9_9GAMM|nr:SLAC1 anion channel family protein [Halochromatium glycolicum]MBK1704147.1 C4-dicarboxylate ABC transporter [Halochromatium glycolicum]